jgi:type IV pilus assembly protein PilE
MSCGTAIKARRVSATRSRAFSLLEVLVVMAVVGILVAIAWPSYKDTVQKSRRADARVGLLDAAQRLERCRTRYEAYDHPDCAVPAASPEGHYRITEPESRSALTFLLRATPIGTQAADAPHCAWLELDHRGQRAAAGKAAAACW